MISIWNATKKQGVWRSRRYNSQYSIKAVFTLQNHLKNINFTLL